MRLIRSAAVLRRLRRAAGGDDGFTMILALGVMTVTALLTAAVFAAVQGDAALSRGDLDGKRAYSAAQAGLQAYVGQLNENASSSSWWQTCANDAATNVAVTGNTDETYSYHPVVNSCTAANAVGTVVDPATGLLRMEFAGKAGRYGAQRTIVADFRPVSPLSYLWYTVHETKDPALDSTCNGNLYSSSSPPASQCWIYWANTDRVRGPMYTQDQFLVQSGTAPQFGRGTQDQIESPNATSVCVVNDGSAQPATAICPSGVIQGKQVTGAPTVPLPADNSSLYSDAQSHGIVLRPGTTTLTLAVSAGHTIIQSGMTCTDSTTCYSTLPSGSALAGTDLTSSPIVYAPNAPTGCAPSYTPDNVSYQQITSGTYSGGFYNTCGDLYVKGTYSTSLTFASANNIVVTGSLLNSTDSNASTTPTGAATLGLVANQYVRVYHPVSNPSSSNCSGATPNLTIDAAILTLAHSFYVDNYDCGSQGTLTVHGAIAQNYRGAVATTASTGYIKNYYYDDRLRYILPAYLFDLQNTSWNVVRETLCAQGAVATSPQSCSYTGS